MVLPHLQQPTIQLLMDHQGTVFLHPSPTPELPNNDPLLRGVVVLDLPRAKRIKSLSVRLIRYMNICFPDYAYEYSQAVQAEVSLTGEKEDRLFEKGVHKFEFTLVVPSSAAPYERSQYGRVYWKVVATAKGDGLMGMDLSTERNLHIVVNPADEGEMQDLDVRVEGFHREIGPWGAIVTSQHLTVGGFLSFDFFLASPPTNMKLLSISGFLHTSYSIKSVEYPKLPEQMVKHKKRIFVVDHANIPAYESDPHEEDPEEQGPSPAYSVLDAEVEGELTDEPLPMSPVSVALARSQTTAAPETIAQHQVSSSSSSTNAPPTTSSNARQTRRFSMPSRGFSARRTSFLPFRQMSTPNASTIKPPPPPLRVLTKGKTYQMSHLAQLPGDDLIRPSTMVGTKTPLRVNHEIVLEARFQHFDDANAEEGAEKAKIRVLKIERPIIISSCCCMLESLLVPSYSEAVQALPIHSYSRPPAYQTRHVGSASSEACACGRANEALNLERERLRESVQSRIRTRSQTLGTTLMELVRPKEEYRPVLQEGSRPIAGTSQ